MMTQCGATETRVIPPVIVTADTSDTDSPTNAPKITITRQQITDAGSTSLAQVLQEFAGIQLQDITGNSSQAAISIRGFGANAGSNTLILVNGVPFVNPDLAPPNLNAIPIQDIAAIEITPGSEGVLYGDQAVGGIVNVVTQQPMKNLYALSAAGGSYAQHNDYAMLNQTVKQMAYSFNIFNNHNNNYRVHNTYDQTLVFGQLSALYPTTNIKFDYQISNERMLYPGPLTGTQVAQNRRQAANDTDFFKDWNGFFHLQHEQSINAAWRLQTDIARRDMHGSGVLFSPFTQMRVIYFVKPQVKGMYKNIFLNSGLEFSSDQYHLTSVFSNTQDQQQNYNLFGIAQFPLTTCVSLSMGMRAAVQNNQLQSLPALNTVNRAIATTVGAIYHINANTKWYARRAGSFRFPKADENAFSLSETHGLTTQQGVSYESGIHWHWHPVKTQLAIYQLNLTDEIAFDPTQTMQRPFGSNKNLAPTIRRGGLVAGQYTLWDRLTLSGQYNFVQAQFTEGLYQGSHIPLVAENLFHANLNYAITPGWNLFTEAIYTGSQFSANDNENSSGQLGGYTIYNVNIHYHYQHFLASLRVNNIFNHDAYLYTVYEPTIANKFFYPAAGRNFLMTLKYSVP